MQISTLVYIPASILALKSRDVDVDQMTYISSILLTLKIFETLLYQAPMSSYKTYFLHLSTFT